MSLVDALPEMDTEPSAAFAASPRNPARDLRRSTAAARVSFTWFGTKKAVSTDQRDAMAEEFDADGESLSASKKLINTKHPAFKAVSTIKTQIKAYWQDHSLPFPEKGIRLIKQASLENFEANMGAFRDDLAIAVVDLEAHYDAIRTEAREKLGQLYNPADYPSSMIGLFAVTWDYPSVEPPDYLMELKPALYEQERRRVAARFEEAVRLAEEGFTTEFAALVGHLCDTLTGQQDNGKPKVLKDSALGNVREFFERFRSLNVGSNDQLDALVEQAQQAVSGVTRQALKSGEARATVASQLASVRAELDTMVVDRPRRRLIRDTTPTTPSPETPRDSLDQS